MDQISYSILLTLKMHYLDQNDLYVQNRSLYAS